MSQHGSTRADLAAYYEEEARLGERGPLRGRRVGLNASFLELLEREDRSSIVDFGSGPGRDGEAFAAAGHRYVGLDLAHGNGTLARTRGLAVVQGSIDSPPFPVGCFDAGWSMSTLMHLPAIEMGDAIRAMVASLRPGAPMVVALWGSPSSEGERDDVDTEMIEGQRRLFSLRTVETNGGLLGAEADIERVETWDVGPDGWNYQVFWLRRGRDTVNDR